MIREVIRPQYTNFTITIPTHYIDREIEFIMFPIDKESVAQKSENRYRKSLRGVFSQYADKSKILSEDNAWQMSVVNRFKSND